MFGYSTLEGCNLPLKKHDFAPENQWLEDNPFPIGKAYFFSGASCHQSLRGVTIGIVHSANCGNAWKFSNRKQTTRVQRWLVTSPVDIMSHRTHA